MDYRKLGRTDLKVSAIALGTMTWGEQNTQAEAFEQIACAKNAGISGWITRRTNQRLTAAGKAGNGRRTSTIRITRLSEARFTTS